MDAPQGLGDQLAMCCGLGRRRRAYGFEATIGSPMRRHPEPNYYYSPSMMQINPGNTWPMIGPPVAPAQPYFLLTQPVILAGGNQPSAGNTMAFIQHHAQASILPAGANLSPFHQQQAISMVIGAQPAAQQQSLPAINELPEQQQQPSVMSSQYAIYGASQNANQPQQRQPSANSQRQAMNRITNRSHQQLAQAANQSVGRFAQTQQATSARQQLSADLFKRLELIEKQVDLTSDMELIERHGIVITRAIDPYTLAPYLTEETLRKYRNYFQFDDDHVIRFIEVIKRPGQTLGIYIRTVQFENAQLRVMHEGLVITKIESDSPIYNSQVLHVGDEILAVNLIDIQGMNLDDVVVLMSIPRRLVLTLRISKERDQDIRESYLNQLQQQSSTAGMLKNSMTQSELMTPSRMFNRNSPRSPTTNLTLAQAHFIRNQEAALAPRTMEHIDGPLQMRDGSGRFAGQPEHQAMLSDLGIARSSPSAATGLYLARPVRVQSALGTSSSELSNERIQAMGGNLVNQSNDDLLNRYTTTGAAAANGHMNPVFSRLQNFDRPSWLNERIGKLHDEKFGTQLDRQEAMSGRLNNNNDLDRRRDEDVIVGDSGLMNEANSRFENLSIDKELASLEREAMSRDRPELAVNGNGNSMESKFGLADSNPQGYQTRQHRIVTPSTLPRRTLPNRPDLSSSSPPGPATTLDADPSIKQPIISNIRLGNTPEQSSYFSSSIEAINRELKELRRQRISFS